MPGIVGARVAGGGGVDWEVSVVVTGARGVWMACEGLLVINCRGGFGVLVALVPVLGFESVAPGGSLLIGVDGSILNMIVTSNWPDEGRVDSAVLDARLLRSSPICKKRLADMV